MTYVKPNYHNMAPPKLCEEGDEEEDDERVGKGDEKGSHKVVEERAFLSGGFAHHFDGVGEQRVQAEDE